MRDEKHQQISTFSSSEWWSVCLKLSLLVVASYYRLNFLGYRSRVTSVLVQSNSSLCLASLNQNQADWKADCTASEKRWVSPWSRGTCCCTAARSLRIASPCQFAAYFLSVTQERLIPLLVYLETCVRQVSTSVSWDLRREVRSSAETNSVFVLWHSWRWKDVSRRFLLFFLYFPLALG